MYFNPLDHLKEGQPDIDPYIKRLLLDQTPCVGRFIPQASTECDQCVIRNDCIIATGLFLLKESQKLISVPAPPKMDRTEVNMGGIDESLGDSLINDAAYPKTRTRRRSVDNAPPPPPEPPQYMAKPSPGRVPDYSPITIPVSMSCTYCSVYIPAGGSALLVKAKPHKGVYHPTCLPLKFATP